MAANDGFGVIIKRDDGAASFDDFAQLKDVSGPSLQRDAIDVTHKASTNKSREFIGGLRDPGEITFSVGYDPASATHAQLGTDYDSDALVLYRLEFGDAGTTEWEFSGLVTQLEPTGPMDGELTADVTIKISGVVDFAP